jgi:hypothetical protein
MSPGRETVFQDDRRPAAGDYRDLMSAFHQRRRKFAQMLRCRDDVGIKRLVEQEDFQAFTGLKRKLTH